MSNVYKKKDVVDNRYGKLAVIYDIADTVNALVRCTKICIKQDKAVK